MCNATCNASIMSEKYVYHVFSESTQCVAVFYAPLRPASGDFIPKGRRVDGGAWWGAVGVVGSKFSDAQRRRHDEMSVFALSR